jgi:hypothetical protein
MLLQTTNPLQKTKPLLLLQVRSVLWQLLELCPTPEAAAAADAAAIRAIITPLGLHNKRATAVKRLSHDFVHKQVSSGSGVFLLMFCQGTAVSCSQVHTASSPVCCARVQHATYRSQALACLCSCKLPCL